MEEGAVAKELLPDELWERIAPLLPPKPKGGRPRSVGPVGLDRRTRPLPYWGRDDQETRPRKRRRRRP